MQHLKQTCVEKIYIIQPITKENSAKYCVLHEEAVALIESAGAQYAGTLYQNVREIHAATFIGAGKLQELTDLLDGLDGVSVLFNGELSPSQTLNISQALGDRKVIDRTTLILDIFAKNAQTSEGKTQVELAQLRYIYPRLKGKGSALSRLGGGVGTRGPGETQLETDRRYIRNRIRYLENKLKTMENRRTYQVARRKKDETKTVALIGYTNTGKSTLLNALTGSSVYAKDELFATLDPTARQMTVDGIPFLMIDTVGFLQDLPHHLIEAFKSTLESAIHCDLALIVCDGTYDYETQLQTTLTTLNDLEFHAPYLIVMNKCEDCKDFSIFPQNSICISAKTGLGLNSLKRAIANAFRNDYAVLSLFIPYTKLATYNKVKAYATEKSIVFENDGIRVNATVATHYTYHFMDFITEE